MVLYRPATTPGASPGFHAAKASTTVRAKTGGKTRVQAPTLSAARRGSVYKPVAGIPFRSMPAKSPEDPEEQTEMPEEEEEVDYSGDVDQSDALDGEPEEPEEPQPEEPELEEPEAADFEELAEPEEVVEPEEELEEPIQESLPEEDAQDTDPVEDLAHANQSSTRSMKSLMWSGSDVESVKRRRLIAPLAPLEPEKLTLLGRWHMASDRACRYVMQAASLEEVQTVRESGWRPAPVTPRPDGRDGKTVAEQLNEKILAVREESYGSQGGKPVDVVTAFVQKWALGAEEGTLRKANHKDLRFVMQEFDESRSITELLEEATLHPLVPREACDKTEEAAGQESGVLTCSRFNRLELIDPKADALVVGDANLTFSSLLARHREALGHMGRIVATTFETIEILRERYAEIDATVKELEAKDAEVFHNVDGTRLAVDPRFQEMQKKFGAVYYNFPHAGVVQGFFDGHPFVRWRHENLMHLFFRALRGFVKPQGLVKVSSNCCAKGVRFSDIIAGARNSEFVHVETLPFQEWSLRGYRRSYGDRRDANRRPEENENYRSQAASSDMVYTFRFSPSGDTPPKPVIRRPPTKDDLLLSREGTLKKMSPEQRRKKAEEIYELFLTYVQGTHVG